MTSEEIDWNDDEAVCRQAVPRFQCFSTTTFWPGQGEQRQWIVTWHEVDSGIRGSGLTRAEAIKHFRAIDPSVQAFESTHRTAKGERHD